MQTKKCKVCGIVFEKAYTTSQKKWKEQKFCSQKCYWEDKKGKPTWNTGTKGIMKPNKTSFKKGDPAPITAFKKGNKPWNAGLGRLYKFICKCCGKEFNDKNRNKKRKFCSSVCVKQYYSKENHHAWKGGITDLYHQITTHKKYKKWRRAIMIRDGFTCRECNQKGGRLEVHHIKSLAEIVRGYKIKTIEQAIGCRFLWYKKNGITLCKLCHTKTDNYCGKGITRKIN